MRHSLRLALWLSVLCCAACDSGVEVAPVARPEFVETHSSDPLFREVSGEVGLDFTHFIGATGEYYLPEIMGPGAALFDYDADGDLDVYLVQGNLLDPDRGLADAIFPPPTKHWPGGRLFRNELVPSGTLGFSDVTLGAGLENSAYGMGVTTGDYDNDGDPDLYLTNFGGNRLYRNDGDGTFVDVTERSGTDDPRWSSSAAFFDFDGDGDLDLFATTYLDFSIDTHHACSSALGYRDYCSPASYRPLSDALFRNEGDGSFTNVSESAGIGAVAGSGLGVAVVDVDGDGDQDLYVANDQRPNHLWINAGDGSFSEEAVERGVAYNMDGRAEAGMGVTAGDFDRDGDEDIFVTHLTRETNTLYVNDGFGGFIDATDRLGLGQSSLASTGFGTHWFDFDNDGLLDLFTANGAVLIIEAQHVRDEFPYRERNQLFRQDPERGRFVDISDRVGPALEPFEVSRGAAFGDVDNDGDVDILVCNNNGPVRLLVNQTGKRNHWLFVRVLGEQSGREGVGARVGLLREGQPTRWRRVGTDGSYLSASDLRVHFGLGDRARIAGLVVDWPSGRSEVWREIEADREVTLEENTGVPWAPD